MRALVLAVMVLALAPVTARAHICDDASLDQQSSYPDQEALKLACEKRNLYRDRINP